MLILNKVIIKNITKILFVCLILLIPNCKVFALEPSFSFFPKGGVVLNKEQGFVVDILINSAGERLVSAKFTVLFDPQYLQVTKAERNNSLFRQWPNDESSIDNDNGVILLTGFTQSGGGDLYITQGESDVLARITFKVLKQGETELDWEYGGSNVTFNTQMLKDGSPPQNTLSSKPESATFRIGEKILDPSKLDTGIVDESLDTYIFVTGIVLVLYGAFMIFTRPGNLRKKNGTVVVYDEE